jgi:hypothetical protein
MIKIISAKILDKYVVRFTFSDGVQKDIDFMPFISKSEFTKQLLGQEYFQTMKVYENGRGVYWPNGYDFCPDTLRYHVNEEEHHTQLLVQEKKAGD